MLVISRKVGSAVVLTATQQITLQPGDRLAVVSINDVSGRSVRVGVQAPAFVRILRQELAPLPPVDQQKPLVQPQKP